MQFYVSHSNTSYIHHHTRVPLLHPWVQCQLLCSSELHNLYIETLEKVGANFSRSLSQYK